MEIKITKTAPGEYDSDVSFSGTFDDATKETIVLLQALGDAMQKRSKDRGAKCLYLDKEVKPHAENKKR